VSNGTRIGTVVAGYRLDAVIGRGGMSVVYLAEQLRLGRRVALKLLPFELAQDDRFRERFLRESMLASKIEHPNIIQIYDAGEDGDQLYIAMRYVEGPSLKDLIRRDGALGLGRVIYIVEQIASALDVAHANGLVHRDVKPANILLDEGSDHAFLTDFGVAKQTTARGMTSTGLFLGTIEYSSPEQIEGRHVDSRTDVYGLGCVVVEGLTARPPFEHDTEVALIHAHLSAPPPTITSRRRELPLGLNSVVATALAKEPDARYQRAGDLAVALREASIRRAATSAPSPEPVPGETVVSERRLSPPPGPALPPTRVADPVAPPPERPVEPSPPRRRSSRRIPAWVALVAALALGGIGAAAAVLATRDSGSGSGGGTHAAAAATTAAHGAEMSTNGAAGAAMSAESTKHGAGMSMEPTGKGPPGRRLTAFVGRQTAWQCASMQARYGATKTYDCATQVPEHLQVSVFGSKAGLDRAYATALRSQRGLPSGTGSCSRTAWHGETPWVHGIGEPGGRAFCYLDTQNGAAHLVWSSRLGTPTLYDATLRSLDHRRLYFWWANFRHELF
jgi:serine/threonine protein kinase